MSTPDTMKVDDDRFLAHCGHRVSDLECDGLEGVVPFCESYELRGDQMWQTGDSTGMMEGVDGDPLINGRESFSCAKNVNGCAYCEPCRAKNRDSAPLVQFSMDFVEGKLVRVERSPAWEG